MTIQLIRRGYRRAIRRSIINGVRASRHYTDSLEYRQLTYPEVMGFRLMVEMILSSPDFKAPHSTSIEYIREPAVGGGEVRGEWVMAAGSGRPQDGALLYIHGGAFIGGSTGSHRGLVSELSSRTGMPAFSVEYRLAPNHPFPAGADDVLAAYRWLLAHGVPAERVVVLGDSAGGHLSLGLPMRAARAGMPVPAAVVGISPVADPALPASRERDRLHRDPLVSARAASAFMTSYRGAHPANHPELALINDDLTVMPPTLIHVGETEFLAADAELFASALEAADVPMTFRGWPGQQHAFHVAHRISSTASTALDEVVGFIREHTLVRME